MVKIMRLKLFRDRIIISIIISYALFLQSIQKFDSHVKFFLIVVSFQASSASCLFFGRNYLRFHHLNV